MAIKIYATLRKRFTTEVLRVWLATGNNEEKAKMKKAIKEAATEGLRLHSIVFVTGVAMMAGALIVFCLKFGDEPFSAYFASMILGLLGGGVMLLGRSLEKDAQLGKAHAGNARSGANPGRSGAAGTIGLSLRLLQRP